MKIKVKYFNENIKEEFKIKKIRQGDWIDLRASQRVPILKGRYYLIPLGVAMELPEGYEAHIVPRSSTFKRWGLLMANSMGIVDESYSGNGDQWYFPSYSTKHTIVEEGDRICQFRIMKKQPELEFEIVDKLTNEDRGGLGSTGRK